jgi:hypothetical protein
MGNEMWHLIRHRGEELGPPAAAASTGAPRGWGRRPQLSPPPTRLGARASSHRGLLHRCDQEGWGHRPTPPPPPPARPGRDGRRGPRRQEGRDGKRESRRLEERDEMRRAASDEEVRPPAMRDLGGGRRGRRERLRGHRVWDAGEARRVGE